MDTFGKLKDISKFDASFFNFSEGEATQCAPDIRIMLEVAWETIVDAGYNPKDLENTPTGVYIGNCIIEAGEALTNDVRNQTAIGFLNSLHSSLPNKISEYFKFIGPSETHDTGCSASLIAFDTAVMAMRRGEISAALIGGCSLNLKPQATAALYRMNMVSSGRGCRVYDASADGYSRAECISLVFIQWRNQARRIYGRVINTVTNNDGFKEQGIIFPSSKSQVSLLQEAYRDTCVNVEDVVYIEAHGTGTQAGDTQECMAVDTFFCKARPVEKEPILIGSIKSNLGHAEPASGVASLCKILLSYVNSQIPPNIHLNTINPKLEAVIEGRVKIVTEKTHLPDDALISLNAFGFGGSNAHLLLLPNDFVCKDNLEGPKAFYVNGRTPNGIEMILRTAIQYPTKGLQDIHRNILAIPENLYPQRGYVILDEKNEISEKTVCPIPTERKPTWLLIGGLGSQWRSMAKSLLKLPIFCKSLDSCSSIIKAVDPDVDIFHILCEESSDIEDDIQSMFLGLTVLVICLVDILHAVGLKIDGVIGHSLGDTLCGYPLGIHSMDDLIKSAMMRSKIIAGHPELKGDMYGVSGVASNWEGLEHFDIACFNSPTHVTVAVRNGQSVHNLRAKHVKTGGFVFHTSKLEQIKREIVTAMSFIGVKTRPENWISTSYLDTEQPYSIGPEFYIDNLCNPVFFSQNVKNIPKGSIVIEVSGNSSFLGLLDDTFTKVGTLKYKRDGYTAIMSTIGKLFLEGACSEPYNIFSSPVYPVPKSTVSISSDIFQNWEHKRSWWVPSLNDFLISSNQAKMNKYTSIYDLNGENKSDLDKFLEGYSIQGKKILAMSVGVYLVWKSFCKVNDVSHMTLSVILTNVQVHKTVHFGGSNSRISLSISIIPASSRFQVLANGDLFMSGFIESQSQVLDCVPDYEGNAKSETYDTKSLFNFYEISSLSNGLISKIDLNDYSCVIDGSSNMLKIIDCHFQMLQLERMTSFPFDYITGATSIILDARGIHDLTWISKPYEGACRSDGISIDGSTYTSLKQEVIGAPHEELSAGHLLGAIVIIGKDKVVVKRVLPTQWEDLFVAYAQNTTTHAIGVLIKDEIFDQSLDLSKHFIRVDEEAYKTGSNTWACKALSCIFIDIIQSRHLASILTIAESGELYDTFRALLDTKMSNVSRYYINVKEEHYLRNQPREEIDMIVNLSAALHLSDVLCLCCRCGNVINLINKQVSLDFGMSSLLKNLSVLNFRPEFMKFHAYWEKLRKGMEVQVVAETNEFSANATDMTISEVIIGGNNLKTIKIVEDYFYKKTESEVKTKLTSNPISVMITTIPLKEEMDGLKIADANAHSITFHVDEITPKTIYHNLNIFFTETLLLTKQASTYTILWQIPESNVNES